MFVRIWASLWRPPLVAAPQWDECYFLMLCILQRRGCSYDEDHEDSNVSASSTNPSGRMAALSGSERPLKLVLFSVSLLNIRPAVMQLSASGRVLSSRQKLDFLSVLYNLMRCALMSCRLQLIDDLSYEDVKKCYRGSVSTTHVATNLSLWYPQHHFQPSDLDLKATLRSTFNAGLHPQNFAGRMRILLPQQEFFQFILVTAEVSDVCLVSMVMERGLCLDINLWIWRWTETLDSTGELTMLIPHFLFWTFWPPNLQTDLRWVLVSLLFQTGTGRQEVSICK